MPQKKTPRITLLCREDGIVAEVLLNGLGLENSLIAGQALTQLAKECDRWEMLSFLRAVCRSGAALDWKLDLPSSRGAMTLFFSGCMTSRGIVVVGSVAPSSVEELYEEAINAIGGKWNTLCNSQADSDRLRISEITRSLNGQLAILQEKLSHAERELLKKTLDLEKLKIQKCEQLEAAVHALKNPAGGILSAIECLIDDAATELAPEQMALLESAQSSGLFLLQLIDELREMSTIECGKLHLDLRPTDAILLVKDALRPSRRLAEQKGIQIAIRSDTRELMVEADPIKIVQVLDNLLNNAVKASTPGGKIEVRISTTEGRGCISIRDEGPEIAPDKLRKIFELFQNDPRSGPNKTLGLAIVKRIVEAHCGVITVKSERGGGAIFMVSLPLASQAEADSIGGIDRKPCNPPATQSREATA
ncbi:MAG: HAMP domain-containing histidine kinase [Acidobacteriaceae bacterium]|nr:HAMP domain-containing histidine kinase [Acidobacteriaceae bacterium]